MRTDLAVRDLDSDWSWCCWDVGLGTCLGWAALSRVLETLRALDCVGRWTAGKGWVDFVGIGLPIGG